MLVAAAPAAQPMRIVLGNSSLVCYPEAGGLWMYLLQYLLGLLALGHDVLWLEIYRKCGIESRDRTLIETFFSRFGEYQLGGHVALLTFENQEKHI